jgi:hypothetical protein
MQEQGLELEKVLGMLGLDAVNCQPPFSVK